MSRQSRLCLCSTARPPSRSPIAPSPRSHVGPCGDERPNRRPSLRPGSAIADNAASTVTAITVAETNIHEEFRTRGQIRCPLSAVSPSPNCNALPECASVRASSHLRCRGLFKLNAQVSSAPTEYAASEAGPTQLRRPKVQSPALLFGNRNEDLLQMTCGQSRSVDNGRASNGIMMVRWWGAFSRLAHIPNPKGEG